MSPRIITHLQTCWLTYRLTHRPADLQTDIQTSWLVFSHTYRPVDGPADWLTDDPLLNCLDQESAKSPAVSGWLQLSVSTPGCPLALKKPIWASSGLGVAPLALKNPIWAGSGLCVAQTCVLLAQSSRLPWVRHPVLLDWGQCWAKTFVDTWTSCGWSLCEWEELNLIPLPGGRGSGILPLPTPAGVPGQLKQLQTVFRDPPLLGQTDRPAVCDCEDQPQQALLWVGNNHRLFISFYWIFIDIIQG